MTTMRGLSGSELLEVWERSLGQPDVERALTLLAAAFPENSREELASLGIGRRDALLLGLHETMFGPALNIYAECPHCAEGLEFAVDSSDIRSAAKATRTTIEVEQPHELLTACYRLRFRLPDSMDLRAAAGCENAMEARRLILRRCVLEAQHGEAAIGSEELPEPVITCLSTHLAQCDPQAEILFDLECPGCNHRWQTILDIASFLWQEINALARHLLHEVAILARAYGWRERDILAMGATRRQRYLEMVS
jgi:hypothetical protein